MDLAVIVVSANDASWLQACLSSVYAHAGPLELEVFVVANACTDGTGELVRSRFPRAHTIDAPNFGFAYGNNRALERTDARYALLLNPDTEILDGTLAELLAALDTQPRVGVAGVRQVDPAGALLPSIRRFPSAARALGEALGSERWPLRPAWSGERVLDPAVYERERDCDWVVGSFLLARREALLSAGLLDERFFLFCEEPDLCLRVMRAGWRVRYLPQLTIRHHAGKGGVQPRMVAQDTFARRQYARKHFAPVHRQLYLGALGIRHMLRSILPWGARGAAAVRRRAAARRALRSLGPRPRPPFLAPPPTALAARHGDPAPESVRLGLVRRPPPAARKSAAASLVPVVKVHDPAE